MVYVHLATGFEEVEALTKEAVETLDSFSEEHETLKELLISLAGRRN